MQFKKSDHGKILFFIPARGGSKGIPIKNIKELKGKPLIYYSIDIARKFADDKDICVSSDSKEIIDVVNNYALDVPFVRPASLATDKSPTNDAIRHALDFYAAKGIFYDVVVLLQPTSPFRKEEHVAGALNKFHKDIDMVVTVCETDANPYYVLFEEDGSGFIAKSKKGNFTRRQDCPKVWRLNGAVYVINTSSLINRPTKDFTKIIKSEMEEIYSVDLDTPLDWQWAEFLLQTGAVSV
jgi:CMP-N,N'-diacetyllegionaminic acid synthase